MEYMPEFKNVMVFGEVAGETLSTITAEVLGCGRKLADDLGEELCVVLLGDQMRGLAQEAISLGADKAYVVEDPLFKDCHTDSYVAILEKIVNLALPRILIFGQTVAGRDLAPRLAFRLGTAATLDCLELSIDHGSKLLLQTKPVYGGNAFATYTCESYPQIATVRAKVMSPLEPDDRRRGEIIALEAGLDPSEIRTKIVARVPEMTEGMKLEDAKVVISGGRGIGSVDGFRQLEELAQLLNGAVGATRSSCDNGWAPYAIQIGLTGKIVTPDLYIAIAISGASQHLTGVAGPKTMVAINRDAEASIFKEARFGIVGNWEDVLPAFTAKIRELLSL